MYMRFVHLKVNEGRLREFRRFYDERVIPALQNTAGCLFSSLLQPTGESNECISLTLWGSPEDVEEYEKSGLFDQLLDESDEYLAAASSRAASAAASSSGIITSRGSVSGSTTTRTRSPTSFPMAVRTSFRTPRM